MSADNPLLASALREFLQSWLPRFREENPHLEIEEQLQRGRHPFLHAQYSETRHHHSASFCSPCFMLSSLRLIAIVTECTGNGNIRVVSLRNESPGEILRQAAYIRSSTGRKASLQVKERRKSQNPSIQGSWTPEFQDLLQGQCSRAVETKKEFLHSNDN